MSDQRCGSCVLQGKEGVHLEEASRHESRIRWPCDVGRDSAQAAQREHQHEGKPEVVAEC